MLDEGLLEIRILGTVIGYLESTVDFGYKFFRLNDIPHNF